MKITQNFVRVYLRDQQNHIKKLCLDNDIHYSLSEILINSKLKICVEKLLLKLIYHNNPDLPNINIVNESHNVHGDSSIVPLSIDVSKNNSASQFSRSRSLNLSLHSDALEMKK